MSELRISLKRDEYTDQQMKDMWIVIHMHSQCPSCGTLGSMIPGPRAGLSFNIKCSQCNTVFLTTPFLVSGAYPVSIDNPPQGERRLIDDKNNHSSRV